MGTKSTMLFVLFFTMHTCMPRGNSAPIPNPPHLQQLQKSENVAAGCEFDQFLSEATSSCDDCDKYCKDGKDSRDCPEKCYGYLDLKHTISALNEKIKQLNGTLQKTNSTQRIIISEQENQIQELSETNAKLQKDNSTQMQTISEQEDQIQELIEINVQLQRTSSTQRNTISELEDQIQELQKIKERLVRFNETKGNTIFKLEHENQKLSTNNAQRGNTIIGFGTAIGILLFIACAILLFLYCTRKQQKMDCKSITSMFELGANQDPENLEAPLCEGNNHATDEREPVQVSEEEGTFVQESEEGGYSNIEDGVAEENVDRIVEPCANDGCSKSPNENSRSEGSSKETNS